MTSLYYIVILSINTTLYKVVKITLFSNSWKDICLLTICLHNQVRYRVSSRWTCVLLYSPLQLRTWQDTLKSEVVIWLLSHRTYQQVRSMFSQRLLFSCYLLYNLSLNVFVVLLNVMTLYSSLHKNQRIRVPNYTIDISFLLWSTWPRRITSVYTHIHIEN